MALSVCNLGFVWRPACDFRTCFGAFGCARIFEISLGKLSAISLSDVSLEISIGDASWKSFLEMSLGNLSWKYILDISLGKLSWGTIPEVTLGNILEKFS